MRNAAKDSSALALLFICALSFLCLSFDFPKKPAKAEFQKGMCYATWTKKSYGTAKSDESLEKVKSLNVEWISILATWYQENCFSLDINPTDKSPSDESVRHAIEKAHSLGMKVMLKPHLDLMSTAAGGWRGEITCFKETDWPLWFESYAKFIMHYAKIAEETGCEMFCIGTELTESTAAKPEMWREIINKARGVYKGALTYAANWNEEYLQIRFWDMLDYAGIDVYFPLSDKEKPTYEELMESWKRWLPEIEEWQKTVNKPVIFPECGYRSSTGAASHPWEHSPGKDVDTQLQLDGYKALADTFWDKEWFYGLYWWDWGTSVKMGGALNRGFTPQNKPAEEYIKTLYSRKVGK